MNKYIMKNQYDEKFNLLSTFGTFVALKLQKNIHYPKMEAIMKRYTKSFITPILFLSALGVIIVALTTADHASACNWGFL